MPRTDSHNPLEGPVAHNNVVNTIAEKLNWSGHERSVRQLTLDGLTGCENYDAYDKRVLDGASVGVARMNGGLIHGSDANALTDVYAKDPSPATLAGILATMLVSFSHCDGLCVVDGASTAVRRPHKSGAPPAVPRVGRLRGRQQRLHRGQQAMLEGADADPTSLRQSDTNIDASRGQGIEALFERTLKYFSAWQSRSR